MADNLSKFIDEKIGKGLSVDSDGIITADKQTSTYWNYKTDFHNTDNNWKVLLERTISVKKNDVISLTSKVSGYSSNEEKHILTKFTVNDDNVTASGAISATHALTDTHFASVNSEGVYKATDDGDITIKLMIRGTADFTISGADWSGALMKVVKYKAI